MVDRHYRHLKSFRYFCRPKSIPFLAPISEVLEGLVSTSKWPRNEAKFLASSRPRPRKTRIKSLVLKMAEKKAKIPRNSSSRPRKGRGKGKNSSPRLVLDLGKILPKVSSSTSSSPDDPSKTSGWVCQSHFYISVWDIWIRTRTLNKSTDM